MHEYAASTYGDRIADAYDQLYQTVDPATIDLLVRLAGNGPALELGIGTGRIALPLAERGIEVHGIDASNAMLNQLRTKAGGDQIPVTLGDFTTLQFTERFALIFVAFNTFFGLPTQEDQIRCFQSVAAHLREDGCFLIEAFVPDLARFDRGQRTSTIQIDPDTVMLEASRHDSVKQRITSQVVRLSEAGVQLFPVQLRYAWPAELDLMARLAGLELRERWGSWDGAAFGVGSPVHVSVYGRSS